MGNCGQRFLDHSWEGLCSGYGEDKKKVLQLEEDLGSMRSWRVCSEMRGWSSSHVPRAPREKGCAEGEGRAQAGEGALPRRSWPRPSSPVLAPSSPRFSPLWTETPLVGSINCARSWNRLSASCPAAAKGGRTSEEGASQS